jgi:hypothetical protein
MQTSRYLAKLIGPVFVTIGVGLLLNPSLFRAMAVQFLESRPLIYLSGLLVLPVGIAIVLAHNDWVADWRVIITVLGWLFIIGGVIRIVVPQLVQSIGGAMFHLTAVPAVAGVFMLVFGAVLGYFGYRASI